MQGGGDWRRAQQFPTITIDFGKFNKPLVIITSLLIALAIGYFNQTDLYDKLNKLPQNRNELTPIKSLHAEIVNGSTLYAKVGIDAISEVTFDNLFRNIHVNVSASGISFLISAATAEMSNRLEKGYEFTSLLPVNGSVSLQFWLFNTPISEPVQTESIIKSLYVNMSLFWVTNNGYQLTNACIDGMSLTTFFVQERVNFSDIVWPYEHKNDPNRPCPDTKIEGKSFLAIQRNTFQTRWQMVTEFISVMAENREIQNFIFANTHVPYADVVNINHLSRASKLCFSDMYMGRTSENLDALRSRLWELDSEQNDVVVVDSTITNVDALTESICPNCSVKKVQYKTPTEIAKMVRHAKFVIGSHSDPFIGTLSMENGTAIEVVRNRNCITEELLEIHKVRSQKTIVYVISDEDGRCDIGQYAVDVARIREAVELNAHLVAASEKSVQKL